MWLLAFFGLCVFAIVAGLYAVKDAGVRRASLILAVIGFLAGFGVEYWGVTTGSWEYTETDMFMVCEIPFEVLVGYATGMFLLGVLIYYATRFYTDGDRLVVLKFFPILGAFFFIIGLFHNEMPWGVGLTFLAIWGLMISAKPSIPLVVGFATFIADVVVEGFLTLFTNYYAWTIGVAVAFMLIGIFIAGVLTRRECNPNSDFCMTFKFE